MKQKKSSQGQPLRPGPAASIPDARDICAFLQERPRRLKTIASHMHIPSRGLKALARLLQDLEAQGKLRRQGERWGLPAPNAFFTGRITLLPSGAGRVPLPEPAGGRTEIHIAPAQCNGAWSGDLVLVEKLPPRDSGHGRVARVLERTEGCQLAVCPGRHQKANVLRPASGVCSHFFLVHGAKLQKNDLVLLKPSRKLRGHYDGKELFQAEAVRSYGPFTSVEAQEAIVKTSRGVPMRFPELALRQAENFGAVPGQDDMESREDMRSVPFVTIDGASAKDFDDAIEVEETPEGFLLRVAIADVSHYVRPDAMPGSLDDEARRRANSWYFPASVEPMLPEALSNGLCSLRPGEDRLAMLAEMPFTRDGLPLRPRFASIVMRSAGRLIYENVAEFFTSGKLNAPCKVKSMLKSAEKLYAILARRRRERGTLDFVIPEPSYKFSEDGALLAMEDASRNDAHMLIEEFMIAANEAVAQYLGGMAQPFLYRVHPAPEPEKLASLFTSLRLTALEALPPELQRDGADAKAILTILANAKGTPQEYLVNRLCLRAMGQAKYHAENIGHFGLASSAYCHFTSPIRRYADLLVHRVLKAALHLNKENFPLPGREELDDIANGLNEQERKSVECERDIARRMACLILKDHIGEVKEGIVSGVTDFGLFVEFRDMPADGLIRMADLGRDWMELDQNRQCLTGRSTGQTWRLGQAVSVRITAVDLNKLEISLVPENASGRRQRQNAQVNGKNKKGGKAPRRRRNSHR